MDQTPPPSPYPPPPPPSYPTSGYPQPVKYPEGTYEGYALASWGSRAGAALLDGLITTIPIWVGIALAFSGADVIGGILIVLGFLGSFFYAPVFMQRDGENNGQSLGKQVLGIRVVRENKEPFSLGQAMLREFVIKGLLVSVVGSFFLYLGPLVNYLWPLWDEQNRAGHDFIASTRVVKA
jgi:uncharacterized RDD family membrane protein YckC